MFNPTLKNQNSAGTNARLAWAGGPVTMGLEASTRVRAPYVAIDVVTGVAAMAEAGLTAGVGVVTNALQPTPGVNLMVEPSAGFLVLASLAVAVLLYCGGAYSIHGLLRPHRQLRHVFCVWFIFFSSASLIVLFSGDFPESVYRWLATWFGAELVSVGLFRFAIARLCRFWNRNGQLNRRAVLVGGGAPAEALIQALESGAQGDVAIVGIFDDRTEQRSPRSIAGYPKLGTVEELLRFARNVRVDLLLITLPVCAEERLHQMLRRLWVLPVDIRLSAYTQRLQYHRRIYSRIGKVPFLDLADQPIRGWNALAKAIEDRLLAAIAIGILFPVMAVIWLAIKLDSRGPTLFKQARYGFNNELIKVYKFRTMYTEMQDPLAIKLTTRDDPRVTRVGRFLRKTSLDELPQLFNVIKGELSMVGPRPQAPMAGVNNTVYAEIVEEYFARTRVKPGITGWAQINGWRGNTDTPEKIQRRVDHDLFYIENWSLLLDLYILARTPLSLLDTENAY